MTAGVLMSTQRLVLVRQTPMRCFPAFPARDDLRLQPRSPTRIDGTDDGQHGRDRLTHPAFHLGQRLRVFFYDETPFLEAISQQEPPVEQGSPVPKLVLLVSGCRTKIHIATEYAHDEFEPVCFLQIGQDLSTGLG